MVEELIAQGYTPEQIIEILMGSFQMSRADAELHVQTALGGSGDVEVEELEELIVDEHDEGEPAA